MQRVKIAGLGHYLPATVVTNEQLETTLEIPAGWIERATGVRERRHATSETVVDMGVAASRDALCAAGRTVRDLDLIVGASSVPFQAIPCTAVLLQRALGAPEGSSACFDLNATCLSFLVALQTVAALIANGSYRTALIVSSEKPTHSLNPAQRESAVLFGHAAAAAVVTAADDGEAVIWGGRVRTYSGGADLTRLRGGGSGYHPNLPTTTREHNLFEMDGPAVYRLTTRLTAPFLDRFLADLGWQREQIDAVIPHQTSRHGIAHLSNRLDFARERVFSNLAERGNCIAAAIPLALSEAVQTGWLQRGQRVLLAGSGAGLTLGALALTF